MSILVLLSPSYFFLFILARIIIYKSKTTIFSFQSNMIITSLLETNKSINKQFNSLPNDKIVDLSKLKTFADDKLIVTQKLKFALGRVENSVGKGENACYQFFLLFPQCF